MQNSETTSENAYFTLFSKFKATNLSAKYNNERDNHLIEKYCIILFWNPYIFISEFPSIWYIPICFTLGLAWTRLCKIIWFILDQIRQNVIWTLASLKEIRYAEQLTFLTKQLTWSVSQNFLHLNRNMAIVQNLKY